MWTFQCGNGYKFQNNDYFNFSDNSNELKFENTFLFQASVLEVFIVKLLCLFLLWKLTAKVIIWLFCWSETLTKIATLIWKSRRVNLLC